MPRQRIPSVIITGFLGSGKTTLIKHLLETSLKGKKVALIENEIGEISVDTTILKTANVEISELTAGCMCCTISGDFSNAVSDILEHVVPDVLLIETTGIANPISVFMLLANDQRLLLEAILTVADAEHLWDNLQENLVAEIQLTVSDIIVLNKCDTVSAATLVADEQLIRKMNERAPVFQVSQGKLPAGILTFASPDELRHNLTAEMEKLKAHYDEEILKRLESRRRLAVSRKQEDGKAEGAVEAHHHAQVDHTHDKHAHGGHSHSAGESYHLEIDEIESFAFEMTGIFSHRKFEDLLSALTKSYYRAKGVIAVEEIETPVIFNYASGRYTFDFETLTGEKHGDVKSESGDAKSESGDAKSVFVFIGKRIGSEREAMYAKLKAAIAVGGV